MINKYILMDITLSSIVIITPIFLDLGFNLRINDTADLILSSILLFLIDFYFYRKNKKASIQKNNYK